MLEQLKKTVYIIEREIAKKEDEMDDEKIIELYFARSERAISESGAKYGAYCYRVAFNILDNREDSEECVNETWFRSWNTIPPKRPSRLAAFFARITRNLALDRLDGMLAVKRGGGEYIAALDELSECTASSSGAEDEFSRKTLEEDINRFLKTVAARECDIFLSRYFYLETTAEIARRYGLKESNVTVILSRTRKKLREFLIKEGYVV